MPTDSSGIHQDPSTFDLRALATLLGSQAMIVMIQPDTVASVDPNTGRLLSADVIETTVRAHGGRPLIWPADFAGPAAEQWTATLVCEPNRLHITCAGHQFYDGTMPISQSWVEAVTARAQTTDHGVVRSDVVLMTGPIPDPASIDAVLLASRASWVRIPLALS